MKYVAICETLDTYIPSAYHVSFNRIVRKGPGWEVRNVLDTYCIRTDEAMEEAVREFLETSDDYLLFVETDMDHPKDIVGRLVKHELPVVGGVQTWKKPPFTPMVYRYRPRVLWGVGPDTQERTGPYQAVDESEMDGKVLQVDGIATGGLLVRRDVLEKAKRPLFSFTEGTQDLYFCRRVLEAGFTIHCDTSVLYGHYVPVAITLAEHRRYKAAQGERK